MRKTQSGFTIIELIVVIALLGILSAVALPRFINVTAEAHIASVEGSGAGFATGIALVRAQVIANGNLGTSTANVSGFGDDTIDVNANGYPVRTSDTGGTPAQLASEADCVAVWEGIQQGGAATVSSAASGFDYEVSRSGDTCTFAYEASGGGNMGIVYDASSGNVTVDSDPNS